MSRRSRGWVVLAMALLVGVALLAWSRAAVGSREAPVQGAPNAVTPAALPAAPTGARPTVRPPLARVTAAAPPPPAGTPPTPLIDEGYPVDLDRLRAEIPRNSYWADLAPTGDPEVLKRREAEAAGWNQLYGKVLSGTGSDAEIRSWFDHRRQVSEDAIDFAQRVLAEHGDELPERDRGLLELAIEMHTTRLAELPRQESEARARKAEQDRRRAAWNGSPPR